MINYGLLMLGIFVFGMGVGLVLAQLLDEWAEGRK